MLKKLILEIAIWCDKHLGWHNCNKEEFNGVSYVGHCKYCGKRCLQDSQGNWFEASIQDDEVEIIEDTPKEDIPTSKLYVNNKLQYDLTPKENKKIEKLGKIHQVSNKRQQMNNYIFRDKINEIIDKINGDK